MRFKARLFAKFTLRRDQGRFMVQGFAFRNGPCSQIFFGPERAAGMNEKTSKVALRRRYIRRPALGFGMLV